MEKINTFFEKNNLRPAECTWLAIVHLLGVMGLIYSIYDHEHLSKIFLVHCIFHNLYALGITVGSHRLWAHKSYKASSIWKAIIMILNCGANQGSIFHWSRDHRLHHKFSDTDIDPHSINKGFFFAHVGWLLQKKSSQLVEEGRKIDMSDLKEDPIVMFQKRNYLLLSSLICFLIPAISYNQFAGSSIIGSFLLSYTTYMCTLNSTWCVNSICHMFGSRPYNSKIEPRENFLVSLITTGQGYHNWHHEYPSDWKASKDEWWMINPAARVIELGSLLGLTTVKRV